jgi:hypothetical protein
MPVFEFIFLTPAPDFAGTLMGDGPLIPVEVSMPAALQEWCAKNSVPIPAPVSGYAMVDTGASISGIHEDILTSLSIVPLDSIPLSTPSGSSRTFIYPTQVSFPALQVQGYSMSRVAGFQLDWTTNDGKRVIMLLGRDLLSQFLLVYNGKTNTVTLAY